MLISETPRSDLRLSNGFFSVENNEGTTIYEARPRGDGVFESEEREFFLNAAKDAIRNNLIEGQEIEFVREQGDYEDSAFFDVQVEGESMFHASAIDGGFSVQNSNGELVYSGVIDLDDEKDVELTLEIAKAGVRQWLTYQASLETEKDQKYSYSF